MFKDHCFITGVSKLEPRDQIPPAWGLFCMAPQLTVVFERVVPTASVWQRHDVAASWAPCHLALHREPWGGRKILAQGLDGEFSVFAWKHFIFLFSWIPALTLFVDVSFLQSFRDFTPVSSCLCHFCWGLWQYNRWALEGVSFSQAAFELFLSHLISSYLFSSGLVLSVLSGDLSDCFSWLFVTVGLLFFTHVFIVSPQYGGPHLSSILEKFQPFSLVSFWNYN